MRNRNHHITRRFIIRAVLVLIFHSTFLFTLSEHKLPATILVAGLAYALSAAYLIREIYWDN